MTSRTSVRKKLAASMAAAIFGITVFSTAFLGCGNICHATSDELTAAAEERKTLPIQSNEIEDWPDGPEVSSEAAIVMDINTNTVLYAKNIHEELYPASTTKIMTCLLASEYSSLNEDVTFSYEAVHSLPSGASNIGMDQGQVITMEEALYGILVGSANEVANAVAEHVSGSIDEFVDLMNEKAKELGCENTHFANTNGLHDDDHYTSVYDLALISAEFFSSELLCRISSTARYHFVAKSTQPDDFYIANTHAIITGEYPYSGVVGGKTGYTNEARRTLVTCAENNGMKLVCIVFKNEAPTQYTDTITLLDYGFNNFQVVNVADNDETYIPDDTSFFHSSSDIFGDSSEILEFDEDDYVIIPITSQLSDADSTISYDVTEADGDRAVAVVTYTYNGEYVGKATIRAVTGEGETTTYSSGSSSDNTEVTDNQFSTNNVIYINVRYIAMIMIAVAASVSLGAMIYSFLIHNHLIQSKADRKRMRKRKKEAKKFKLDIHNYK
ncbi:MAG: D-alanyl-D-alanine carboxypeptidase [Butyrivibrio sp.]|nr:D-alanyl-D-alanine carboxypeptidase [Butyrivibrio sp.]